MLLWIDTETGGADPRRTSVLEWAGVITDDKLVERDALELKIRPESGIYLIQPEALEINKIDIKEHSKTAIIEREAGHAIMGFLGRNAGTNGIKLIPAGWNVGFDISFTTEDLITRTSWHRYCGYSVLDVASVAKFVYPGTRSLQALARRLGSNLTQTHRALDDVRLTIAVYRSLCRMRDRYILKESDEVVFEDDIKVEIEIP